MLFIHLRTYRSWIFHSGIGIAEYFDEPWPWFWLDLNHGQRVLARISLAAYPVSGPIEIIRTTVSGTRRDNCSFSDRLPPTDDFPPLCSRNWKSAFVSVWDIYIYMFWDYEGYWKVEEREEKFVKLLGRMEDPTFGSVYLFNSILEDGFGWLTIFFSRRL